MIPKEYLLVPLFQQFMKDSYKGKRLKPDGSRIKKQTVNNYSYVLRYLLEFEEQQTDRIRIKIIKGENKRLFTSERNYWRKFYERFTHFLYHKKNCYDNYVGTVIKTIRIFFNWLNREKGIKTGDFYKSFYVCREEVPIVTLLPEQLQFLINDNAFHHTLPRPLQKSKAIFVFGCTVALRVSDLFNIKFSDIESVGEAKYLAVKTIKTGAVVRIKLPAYAVEIAEQFRLQARNRTTIFPPIPRTRFNNQLKAIAEAAGWQQATGKQRTKKGIASEIAFAATENKYRFCDLVSSHTMRRTAITTMLMLGMKEHVVKQISGHANDSKSFYRYVNLVQSYLDNEMDMVFDKLAKTG
jgi:integrase